MKKFIIGGLFCVGLCAGVYAQPIAPATTPWSRGLLKQTNGTDAQTYIGISGGGSSSNALTTNAPNQLVYQTPNFLNGITMTNTSLFQQTTPGAGFNMFWNVGHSIEAEEQAASTGSFSFTLGTDQQKLSVLQLTGSGAYDTPILAQYDTTTNVLGWSTPLIFGFKSGPFTGLTNHYWGMSAIGTATNNGASVFKIYSSWVGGDTLFAGAQTDSIPQNVVVSLSATNDIFYGSVGVTNALSVGSSNILSATEKFGVYDPSDAGQTQGQISVNTSGNITYLGRSSSTSGKNSVEIFQARDGTIIMEVDPANSRVFVASGFQLAVGKTTPTNTLDINGGISTGSLVVSNGITGQTTIASPGSGIVGEVLTSSIATGSAGGITSATPTNITSISLTAGYWMVTGNANYRTSLATATASTLSGISTTTGTMPTDGTEVPASWIQTTSFFPTGSAITPKLVNVSTTTSVYLVGQSSFTGSAGTVLVYGSLQALRVK